MKKLGILSLLLSFVIVFFGCSETISESLTTSSSQPTQTSTTLTSTSTETTTSSLITATTAMLREDETQDIDLDFDLSSISYITPTKAITLHSVLSDHAVLQQNKPIRVFGTATPGTVALVKLVNNLNHAISYKEYGIVDESGEFVVTLPALTASFQTYTLTVSDTITEIHVSDLLIGEVWIAGGQSNMGVHVAEMEDGIDTMATASNNNIRIFYQYEGDNNGIYPFVPAYDVRSGIWKSADSGENIANCSGVAYSFAKELYRLLLEEGLHIPIAIINTAKGGSNMHSWLPRSEMMASDPIKNYVLGKGISFSESTYNQSGWENYNQPSALFNQKISPLFNYQIKGVLWYQGESDAVYDPTIYSIPLLIDTWSRGFNQNDELLPFVLIQIAPYDGSDPFLGPSTSNYYYTGFPSHRQAQLDVVKMEKYANTTVIVPIYDISLKWDVPLTQFQWKDPIHPLTKIPVGDRAGKIAYSNFYYGIVDFSAPIIDSYEYDATSITITFSHVSRGLKLFKDTDAGVTTVEIFKLNGTRETVNCEILDQNRIIITGIDTSQVDYFSYSYFTRNEASNLSNFYGTPAIPFKVKLN